MILQRRIVAIAAAWCCALLAAGCNGSSGDGAAVSASPSTRQLDEHANRTTVDVSFGGTIVVVLHSTYWTFDVPPPVLQPLGAPQVSPSHCPVVGSGCGTVTSTYNAAHVGTVTLHAHRDSCGEARKCTGSDGDWTVTVRVS